MSKFFIGSFLIVLTLYILIMSMSGYVGVYIHYIGVPLLLTLLLLAFITRLGQFRKGGRIERTLEDDEYDFFDFIRDCWRVTFVILKIPFQIALYVRDDYREYKASNQGSEDKNN